jgi:hypothetical protein
VQDYLRAIQSVVVAVAVAVELAAVAAANFEAAVEEGALGRLVGTLFAAGGPYYLREAVVQT